MIGAIPGTVGKGIGIVVIVVTCFGLTTSAARVDPVLVGAGDIGSCDSMGDEATARLLDRIDGTVFTTGDNAYDDGTESDFINCYDPSWGRHKDRTRPAAGNHEYKTEDAAPYYTYFGPAAGLSDRGYYSYQLGTWHVVVLNSNCDQVGGCDVGSPQEQWLRADLAANPSPCTIAYWHSPRFSSALHGNDIAMQAFWQALYEAGVDVVLAGHDHSYERFAPQDATGQYDPERGIREFVVGTGGSRHYAIKSPAANSEIRNDDTFGVLALTLRQGSYDWKFIPEAGKTFTDSGSARCHQ